jgi:LmbE family N-acetylglucosaminyl deacetylase
MNRILAVAPHPDDETLGCGGALLRHRRAGDELHWLIATEMTPETGYAPARIKARDAEIRKVSARYGFKSVTRLGFGTGALDALELSVLVGAFSRAFRAAAPDVVYLPHRGDPHSDHRIVFDCAAACTKAFRFPSIRRVLSYEALSETDFSLDPAYAFKPNVFIDIGGQLEGKIQIMRLYRGELGTHPFPRSEASLRALATLRGAAAGFKAAEAFLLLKERL